MRSNLLRTFYSPDRISTTFTPVSLNFKRLRSGSVISYSQVWLRGDPEGPSGHVHEGVRLADKTGWLAVGELLPDTEPEVFKILIRAVDNEATTKRTRIIGDGHQNSSQGAASVGFSIIEVNTPSVVLT